MATAECVKERPILFRGRLVREILDDTKTQTRRVVKLKPGEEFEHGSVFSATDKFRMIESPYGKPGDRLWVRETWVELLHTSPATDQPLLCEGDKLIEHATPNPDGGWYYDGKVIAYRATSDVEFCDGDGFSVESGMADPDDVPRWRPSIHMPRAYSRIDLEIVSVRVEHLQRITDADAIAEGCRGDDDSPREEFRKLWDEINGEKYPWDSDPLVWVICFKRV